MCRRLVFLFLFWLLCLFIISTVKAAVGNTYLLITVVSNVVLVVTSITPVQQTFVLFIDFPLLNKETSIQGSERGGEQLIKVRLLQMTEKTKSAGLLLTNHTYAYVYSWYLCLCFYFSVSLFSLFIIDDYDKVLVWFGLIWLAVGCWVLVCCVCCLLEFQRKKLSLSLFLDWRLAKFIQRCYGMFVSLASSVSVCMCACLFFFHKIFFAIKHFFL